MTFKSEFLDIFDKWHEIVDTDTIYLLILQWLNKYKNIVKDQTSINDILWRINIDDHNLIIDDFIHGACYESLREEINNFK